jgi:hypothetical protein
MYAIYNQFFGILFLWKVTIIHIDDTSNSCIVMHASSVALRLKVGLIVCPET